ncbi:hypothetical protein NP493_250g04064 [Ridgeia piscesae]|uniref:EF-hand domain-containing protein n=1 Tax=Ridgeia piscesae TaxID=27915 RepID=A0AAD9NYP7_RIDPI|nr:hypothetical protein NP493_250g04064 [Ridgeia piscesae]
MPGRQVRPEVQRIFQKYIHSNLGRRLAKKDAILMLENEFALKSHQAELLFDHFDADQNGFFSLWEFQHFYDVVGVRAADIVQKFESLDTEGVGHFRAETARAWLESVQPDNDQALSDKQIDFLVKVAVGDEEEDAIDLVKFADLVTRLDLCLKQQQAQKTT